MQHSHNKFLEKISFIDTIIKKDGLSNKTILLKYLKNEQIRYYFFSNLDNSNVAFEWFQWLIAKDFFKPKKLFKQKHENFPQKISYIPKWDQFNFLEKISEKNEVIKDNNIAYILVEMVDSLIEYRFNNPQKTATHYNDISIIRIYSYFPIRKIKKRFFDFVKLSLNSNWDNSYVSARVAEILFPKIFKHKLKKHLNWFLPIWFGFKIDERMSEYVSIANKYWFNESLKKYKEDIFNLGKQEAYNIVVEIITKILKKDNSQFNHIWIPAIEDHPQTSFPDRYECQLIYFLRDFLESLNERFLIEETTKLLNLNFTILNRLVIHTINRKYKLLKKFLWAWKDNPLNNSDQKHELYELFKNHSFEFKKNEINIIIRWIDNIDLSYAKDEDVYIAGRKKTWLIPLLKSNHVEVKNLYDKYNKIYPKEISHPEFDFWSESKSGYDTPFTAEELDRMSNAKIIDALNNFQQTSNFGDPSEEGLRREFKSAVLKNPLKYSKQINKYANVKLIYIVGLIDGFKESWKTGQKISWGIVLNFILKIIDTDSFWSYEKGQDKIDYRNWIVGSVADLIVEGTRRDESAFDKEYLPHTEKILLILVSKDYFFNDDNEDLVFSVLNSTKGSIFQAMINYSLRYARLNLRAKRKRWKETIKNDFEQRLKSELSPEYWVIIGEYLHNLNWLDKKWVTDNFNRIFNLSNTKTWKYAITGYLFYADKVYKNIYDLFKNNGHYSEAINTNFPKREIRTRIAEHIGIAYLSNLDKIEEENSLVIELLESNNTELINELVLFIWHFRDNIPKSGKKKVLVLWEKIYNIVKRKISKIEYQRICSNLTLWLTIINKIDRENILWIKYCAKYVEIEYHSSFFINYLADHIKSTPKYVAEIYIEMLQNNVYPLYDEKHVFGIVTTLYSKKNKEFADRICNLYAEGGHYLIRGIYEQNNS